ncbi:uncharacterized protein LOC109542604 [Dendroctonus ponderosae]|uniref:uncharacterized protein LOC109542604 n=1 Tax=Dendroctonus ponderosae TaxID=77166 RepID=UPI002034E325|nr:uncharacterized protein LOC109542604 [Dendroctonus ponderosae]
MSPDNESCIMKGSKPPPPVPPRPSRSVVKEALAKTRQAYGTVQTIRVSSTGHLNRPNIPLSNSQLHQQHQNQLRFGVRNQNADQNNHKSLPCYPDENLNHYYSSRPIVYQSQNCKSRPEEDKKTSTNNFCISSLDKRQLVGKSSFKGNLNSLKKEPRIVGEIGCDLVPASQSRSQSPKVADDEPKYANVSEPATPVNEFGADPSAKPPTPNEEDIVSKSSSSSSNTNEKHWDDILNDRNHVNTLIDEMFASVLEVNLGSSISPTSSNESIATEDGNKITISNKMPPLAATRPTSTSDDENLTVIVINDDTKESARATPERKVTFNDRENHEFLIEELQSMQHHQGKVPKRQFLGSLESVNGDEKIHMSDWYGVNDGKKVRLSSCHITIEDPCEEDGDPISRRKQKINNIAQAYRLPPLPKSLSAFKLMANGEVETETSDSMQSKKKLQLTCSDSNVEIFGREQTNLDRQLALLRREMVSLREQDLSLLAKLWFLSESIHDFRQMMQEQDDDKLNARFSPSPAPSSLDDEDYYVISTSTC